MQKSEYERKLVDLGCQLIGKGYFATVYSIPGNPDKCIKVANPDEWPLYIKWSTQNGYAGTFAPMVYSLKFHDDFYVAIMERLVCTIGQVKNCYPWQDGINRNHLWQTYMAAIVDREAQQACDLAAYVNEIRDLGNSNDFHDGNVMVRKDGQLVITDPFSFGSSGKFRIKSGKCL